MAEEPSLIDYARFYGLAKDHLTSAALHNDEIPQLLDIDQALFDTCHSVSQLLSIPERLSFPYTKTITELLNFGRVPPPELSTTELDALVGIRRGRGLKVDLPLLRTDNELDMVAFLRHRSAEQIIPRAQLAMKSALVDLANVDSPGWPPSCSKFARHLSSLSRSEKLEFSREVLSNLGNLVSVGFLNKDCAIVERAERKHSVSSIDDSSMMLPIPFPDTPIESPLRESKLEAYPPEVSPIKETETQEASPVVEGYASPPQLTAEEIICDDNLSIDSLLLGREDEDSVEAFKPWRAEKHVSPLSKLRDIPSSLEGQVQRGLLTPPITYHDPVRIVDDIPVFTKELPNITPAVSERVPSNHFNNFSPSDIEDMFEALHAPASEDPDTQDKRRVTSDRFYVPVAPFTAASAPIPPWKTFPVNYLDGTQSINDKKPKLVEIIKEKNFKGRKAPDGLKEDDPLLEWSPFSSKSVKAAKKEEIPFDRSELGLFLEDKSIEKEIKLVSHPKVLLLRGHIRHSVDQRDIQVIKLQPPKRKSDSPSYPSMILNSSAQDECQTKRYRIQEFAGSKSNGKTEQRPIGFFSAADELRKFMQIRKIKAKEKLLPALVTANGLNGQDSAAINSQEIAITTKLEVPPVKLPQYSVPETPSYFIFSSVILRQRSLYIRLRSLYPTARIIERDFKQPISVFLHLLKHRPSSVHEQLMSSYCDDADIITSPKTGLICTTLQKIKQRALPGQLLSKLGGCENPVQTRIYGLSKRYERLIVLVSEDLSSNCSNGTSGLGSVALSENDSQAIQELEIFSKKLVQDTRVVFVAGREEELAHYVVAAMIEYRPKRDFIYLLAEESQSELLLRAIGLNAYASQLILLQLINTGFGGPKSNGKNPMRSLDQPDSNRYAALSTFVNMTSDERLRLFENILGGRKLILLANERIDFLNKS
ncbi:MAG: hypothetical protein M1829_001322 [Trizodia sp. TS-e1964]|nr:MAG: hypothetical protein M1829_001322 [Trizodia sp. TS-e1964]